MQFESITSYIPQRPPFLMVDELLEVNDAATKSRFLIHDGHIFVNEGLLEVSGMVENIAQTAAAGVGYACKVKNEDVPIGFIAAVRDLIVHNNPASGTEVETVTTNLQQIMDVSIVKGEMFQNQTLLASCELRIFLNPKT